MSEPVKRDEDVLPGKSEESGKDEGTAKTKAPSEQNLPEEDLENLSGGIIRRVGIS